MTNWEERFRQEFYDQDAHPSEPDIIQRAHGEDIKDFIRQVRQEAYIEGLERAKHLMASLAVDHCCEYGCDCDKEHLYCGYELEHGIELESVEGTIQEEITKAKQ